MLYLQRNWYNILDDKLLEQYFLSWDYLVWVLILYLLWLGLCKPFDVSLGSDGSPFIFYEKQKKDQNSKKDGLKGKEEHNGGMWWPICGQFFSENNHGANLFCRQLNSQYTGGSVVLTQYQAQDDEKSTIPMDSFMVGKCNEKDRSLQRCSDRCNLRDLGGNCENQSCTAGKGKRVKIQCHGRTSLTPEHSCQSKCNL